jgi:hypothetical protein
MILTVLVPKLLDFQGSDPITPRQHALMKLNECVWSYVIEASFYKISQLSHINLNHTLITMLIER